MIDITDQNWVITILFLFNIVIGAMCLFSIPILVFMGLPWHFFVIKILEGVACLYFIIVGILCLFSEYPEERKTLATEVPKYWQGFLLLLSSVVIVYVLLILGEKRWKFWTHILKLREELKLATIFGVIISIVSVMVYVIPETIFLLMLGYGFFVLMTLWIGWQIPKWYVKLYTAICFSWVVFYFFVMLGSPYFGTTFIFLLEIGVTLPLIPLWYLWYKGTGEQKREEESKKAVAWELEDQLKELKEQLGRGAITQKEYEQRREKLLERPPELEEQGYTSARAAAANELEGQLAELKKQMLAGTIHPMEYEHKKIELLEELTRLKKMLIAGVINLRKYKQEKKKLLEKYQAR